MGSSLVGVNGAIEVGPVDVTPSLDLGTAVGLATPVDSPLHAANATIRRIPNDSARSKATVLRLAASEMVGTGVAGGATVLCGSGIMIGTIR